MREKIKRVKETLKQNSKVTKAVITLLIFLSLTGVASFAWFSARVTGNETAKTTTVKAADLEITYVDGTELKEENITPGWTGTKTFSVENTGDATVTYKVAWKNLTNNFVNRQYLVYRASSTNGGGALNQTQVPDSENHIMIMDEIAIPAGVTQSYTLTMQYLNADVNQNSDQGRSIAGVIEVLDVRENTIAPETTRGPSSATGTAETLYGKTMEDLVNTLYPVGSIYTSTSSTSPSEIMGGTWERYGEGQTLVGVKESDEDFSTPDKTGGEKNHTLTIEEMPSHSHAPWTYTWYNPAGGSHAVFLASGTQVTNTSYKTQETGGSQAHNNMQPYITVYMWKRIS